jgi:SAM-dependent MidA family methyltransferase
LDALTDEEIVGCFVSNELLDAFPVHRVAFVEGQWREIYVTVNNNGLTELLGDISSPDIHAYCARIREPRNGQHIEINMAARRCLEDVARCLERGFVITIDYGDRGEKLHAPERSDGTLLCYHAHRISAKPYERIGRQDMTAHVDFSALIDWGRDYGLTCTGLVPQYRFLLALGIAGEMQKLLDTRGDRG